LILSTAWGKQRALAVLGLLVLFTSWFGPLPQLARSAFFAHMILHMAVVAIAAPLLAIGIAGTKLDPVRKAPILFAPIPASVIELVVVWAWHTPALHHAARHTSVGFLAEQGTFLLSGFLVWFAAFGGNPDGRSSRNAAGIIALLLTSMHMTLLGALLALTPHPLYSHTVEFFTLTALEDQHLGGAIMLLAGGISYLLGGLTLAAGLLRGNMPEPNQRV
jgi:putative membrane protein